MSNDAFLDTFPAPAPVSESGIRPPPAHPGFVLRSQLVERLTTAEADVIALTAPTGYGKTTTVAQWAQVEPTPMAWLSLSRDDNNAKTLLAHLAASIRRIGILTAEDVAFFQFMGESEAATRGASHFASLLAEAGDPVVVTFDNADVLRSRASNGVVEDLVSQLEGTARIAVASHSTPKVGLAAVRSSGRLLEITKGQLAFSAEEVEQLITGLGLDPRIVGDLMESTEGWPAATYLMAYAARDRNLDLTDFHIEGQRHLNDFVRSEIFPHLSRRRRRFLTLMSPLERMSGPLCDAVSTTTGSADLLDSLESDTHLVHHVDHEGTWFGLNPILRAAFAAELDRDPDAVRAVHTRAATWFAANGMPLEAIRHAQKAEDPQAFAHLMESLIKSHFATGHVAEVLMWMDWLQRNVSLDQYPRLAAIGALVHLQEGNGLETERWLDAASRAPVVDDAGAVIWLVRAASSRFGVGQMMRDIDLALETARPGSGWLPAILVTKGLAQLLANETDLAEACFAEAVEVGLESQSFASVVLALGQWALIAIRRQDWDHAVGLADQALTIIEEYALDDYHVSGLALIAAAHCARRSNDINRTQTLLARASRVRPKLSVAMPAQSVQILIEMARGHVELSDVAGARALIREADEILLQRPDLGVLPAAADSLKDALANLGPGNVVLTSPLTRAELRVLPLLATHMTFPEIGEQLFVSRHTVKSQATSIYRKLGCSTRSEAIAKAYDIGLLNH